MMGVCGTYLCFLFFLSACFFPFFVVSSLFLPVLSFSLVWCQCLQMMWHIFMPLESLLRQLMGEGSHYIGGHCEWLRWKSGVWGIGGVDGGAMGWWWAVGKIIDICCGCTWLSPEPYEKHDVVSRKSMLLKLPLCSGLCIRNILKD